MSVDRTVRTRKIKFLHPGAYNHVIKAFQPVINFRALEVNFTHRREIAYKKSGSAPFFYLGYWSHGDSVAVSELKMSVNPALGLGRQPVRGQFPCGQHYLSKFIINRVPVGMDSYKVIIEAKELDLVITLKKGAFVPQADIVNGPWVGLDDAPVNLAPSRVAAGDHVFKPKSVSGVADIFSQVISFPGQFAGFDHQALDQAGNNAAH